MSYLGKITLSDCIIAGNTIDKGASAGDLRSHMGILILSGVNLIASYTVHGGSIVRNHGTTIAAAPLLEALADNGGPSKTMALLPGSPAIDAAVGSSSRVDQRGFRVVGTADIGAFEAGGSTAPPPEGEGIR